MFKSNNNWLTKLDDHTKEVLSKSSISTVLKMIGMVLGLLISIFIGRILGPEGLGILNLSNRIINILIVVGLFGMRQVIIKEVAISHRKGDYDRIGNVMHTGYWFNGLFTVSISVVMILLAPWLAENIFHEPLFTYPFIILLLALAPQVFSRIFSSALIGYRKIWQSNLIEQTLSVAISGFILATFWILEKEVTIIIVAVIYAISRATVTISIGLYWKILNKSRGKRRIIFQELFQTSKSMFIVTISAILMTNSDIIILGWLCDSEEVGLYAVAARIAFMSGFVLKITNSSVSPKIAALYESGRINDLSKMLRKVNTGLGLIGMFLLILFIVFGSSILKVWGEEFQNSYWILVTLSFGQFINLSTGSVGLVMIMTGYEKLQSYLSITFTIINIILNIIMINFFGVLGAAFATAFSVSMSNLVKVVVVRRIVGINTLPF